MIVILDYDMGNVGSIKNMLKKIKVNDVYISRDATIVSAADKMILPGVGSFDAGVENIEKYGLRNLIHEHAVTNDKPLLGICLGMQLLGNSSEEGTKQGLGIIDFKCKKFNTIHNMKIPHMGWKDICIIDSEDPLVMGLDNNQRYYFVHSYYAECYKLENILMTCNYGIEFCAAVRKGNTYGVQFHPEKSHKYGMNLLRRFANCEDKNA